MKIGKHTFSWSWGDIVIGANTSFEYQFSRELALQPFEFYLWKSAKQDHAGFEFVFSIYKLFWICFKTYDHRHWDDENNCWFSKENNSTSLKDAK